MLDVVDKIRSYQEQGIKRVKLAVIDIDGVHRGKYISLDKFESLLKSCGGFCDCIFGWDVNDLLYDNGTKFTGWHTAFPDALYKIDISTERLLPDENVPFFIADFVANKQGDPHSICPRNLLKRILAQYGQMGLSAKLAFEYEFFLFNETPHSVREKNYQNLEPLTPGMFGYSMIRNSTYSDLFNDFMDYCMDMNFPLEALHCETGPGVWEGAIKYNKALEAVDQAALFKTFTKVYFQRRGIMATFMARWNLDYPGQSGHIHQSLYDSKKGVPLFFDMGRSHQMSELMTHYVAGQVKYLK